MTEVVRAADMQLSTTRIVPAWRGTLTQQVTLLLLFNALVWTAYATLGGMPLQHQDSFEAYVWGREFALGYYKHPPLWGWIAGLWFKLLPRQDWALYFLSELNASLGLLGAWFLTGRFVRERVQTCATLLLLLTTLYSFNALRFNANTMQLSLWPWTMYFFVRSLEEKSIRTGVLFGLFAGLSVLSKYYALLMLASCFAAALMHQDRRAYFGSACPWIAYFVFELVIAPHVVWLVRDGYQPVLYAISRVERPDPKFVDTIPGFLVACVLFQIVPIALAGWVRLTSSERLKHAEVRHGLPVLIVLALGPMLLTIFAGLAAHMRVTPLYAVPIFSLTPLLLIVWFRPAVDALSRHTLRCYGVMVTACLICAPAVPYVGLKRDPASDNQPYHELADEAARFWTETTGTHAGIVAGSWPYSLAATFYLPGDVSEFTDFEPSFAPWITPERLRQEGLLYICVVADDRCLERARALRTTSTIEVERTLIHRVFGAAGRSVTFVLGAIPPTHGDDQDRSGRSPEIVSFPADHVR